ncbi:MAG: hypothetical protein AAFW87_12615 [Pseudomonadota bacterium]
MPSDKKRPVTTIPDGERDPAKPVAEREPGETARPDNGVKAKDSFGAPRPDKEWTREAMATQTAKPSLSGSRDRVVKEQVKDLKE